MSSPAVPQVARRRHRTSALALGLGLVLSSVSVPGSAHAAIPPQDPGVTLRTYSLATDLNGLCTLKPGQTPNFDKLMPTINWSTQTDFGIADRFLTQVVANINITTPGAYTGSPATTAPACASTRAPSSTTTTPTAPSRR